MTPDTCTYEDICTFCDEVSGADSLFYSLGLAADRNGYVLAESEHFVVVPCVGALTDWYVLIVPRRHVLSSGWLTDAERTELRTVRADVVAKVSKASGRQVILFEHGSFSFRDKGGACHDHAHIHVVATDRRVSDFVELVSAHVNLTPCDDWLEEARNFVQSSHRSYLALWSPSGSMIAPAIKAPSQFFRRSLVQWLDEEEGSWDWLVFPQSARLRVMLRERLQ